MDYYDWLISTARRATMILHPRTDSSLAPDVRRNGQCRQAEL
jgi:hypothetical protein